MKRPSHLLLFILRLDNSHGVKKKKQNHDEDAKIIRTPNGLHIKEKNIVLHLQEERTEGNFRKMRLIPLEIAFLSFLYFKFF